MDRFKTMKQKLIIVVFYRLTGSDGCSLKRSKNSDKPIRPYVKKPLNAFMLYMKEQRAQVVAECTLKESAAINQILGRKVIFLEQILFPNWEVLPIKNAIDEIFQTSVNDL